MSNRQRATQQSKKRGKPLVQTIGFLEALVGQHLHGWAALTSISDPQLTVAALVDGVVVSRTIANTFRADLLASGIGDGCHGFSIMLPATLFDNAEHNIQIVASRPDEFEVDSNTPGLSGSGMMLLTPTSRVTGNVDEFANGTIAGWVYDTNSSQQFDVELRIDGVVVATGLADKFRKDLSDAGFGDGLHAFWLRVPDHLLDGRMHRVEVLVPVKGSVLPPGMQSLVLELRLGQPTIDTDLLHLLFDRAFYAQQSGVTQGGLAHYMAEGWLHRFDPHPLFSTEHYLAAHGQHLTTNPLLHFVTVGILNDHSTHPLFDAAHYRHNRPDISQSRMHPLHHYLSAGWKERVSVSPYFDEQFYENQCPGVRSNFAPIVHYLQFGWKEGIWPNQEFNPRLFHAHAGLGADEEPLSHLIDEITNCKSTRVPNQHPSISFLVLNHNKPILTIQCLYFLQRFTDLRDYEVIVVDNGSRPDAFSLLCYRIPRLTRVIRLTANRGFGEGNNIGVESAQGEFLVFLNNDCFVMPGWFEPLHSAIVADETIGAVGPRFIYPDGRLQEAGAMITPCGAALQRGKGLDGQSPLFAYNAVVDYVSAAALMVRAKSFHAVLGFDLCWDPAYYEDVDLCLKLRLLGKKTLYVANSSVVHLENSTSSDRSLNLHLDNIVAVNRLKFVSRWGRYLQNEPTGDELDLLPLALGLTQPSGLPRLGLYTPFSLTPGGGERYLLTCAAILRDQFDCTLVTPERFSRARLMTLARVLDLKLDHVHVASLAEIAVQRQFDVFVAMGNQVLPPIRGLGVKNLFLCQFPFPLEPEHYVANWTSSETYSGVIVYSAFAARHVKLAAERTGVTLPPCHVVHPPVPQVVQSNAAFASRTVILNVGRFTPHGHCKRQDVMIESFLALLKRGVTNIELHLAGSIAEDVDSRNYIAHLQKMASGAPVSFHINISVSQIHTLYRQAKIYWHLTGIGDDARVRPEVFEHFGITIVEAMSAGVVPIVLGNGGPPEIISHEKNGLLIYTAAELQLQTAALLTDTDRLTQLSFCAQNRARDFAPSHFKVRLHELLGLPDVQLEADES